MPSRSDHTKDTESDPVPYQSPNERHGISSDGTLDPYAPSQADGYALRSRITPNQERSNHTSLPETRFHSLQETQSKRRPHQPIKPSLQRQPMPGSRHLPFSPVLTNSTVVSGYARAFQNISPEYLQCLHSYDEKIHENRLRRWDFFTPESYSHGLRSKCSDPFLIVTSFLCNNY